MIVIYPSYQTPFQKKNMWKLAEIYLALNLNQYITKKNTYLTKTFFIIIYLWKKNVFKNL